MYQAWTRVHVLDHFTNEGLAHKPMPKTQSIGHDVEIEYQMSNSQQQHQVIGQNTAIELL